MSINNSQLPLKIDTTTLYKNSTYDISPTRERQISPKSITPDKTIIS